MAGFFEDLGQGLQSAGAILSPDVYKAQAQERRESLDNFAKGLQIKKLQREMQADQKFSESVSGLQPDALKDSSSMLDALKGVPMDVIAESPKAQAALKMVSSMQAREAAQEQRKQMMQFRYDQLQQQHDIASERAEDKRLSDIERARANLAREQMQSQLVEMKRQIAGLTPGGQAQKRDYEGEFKKLDPAGQTALDFQAWNYINKNQLPYRKGSGGGADRNDPIIHRAGQIAVDLGMSPQELSSKSAEFKSNAQTLYFQTKKLNAIQGTLESLHNNISTFESIAAGEVPKLGGDKLSQIRDQLKKIDFSDVKTLNDWEIKVRTQFNDPAMVAYVTSAFTVAMDYSRIISSQGQSAAAVTEGARNEALKLVAAGYNEKSRKALIGTLESDASGQVKGLETQTNRLRQKMGLKPEEPTATETKEPKYKTNKADDLEPAAVKAWGKYEPEKYDYRMSGGKLQRRPKEKVDASIIGAGRG